MKKILLKIILITLIIIPAFSFERKNNNDNQWYGEQLKEFLETEKHINIYTQLAVAKNNSVALDTEEVLLKSIEKRKNNYIALMLLGIYYVNVEEDYKKAEEYFKKAIKTSPYNKRVFPSYKALAIIYSNLKMENEAEAEYKKMIQIFPEHPEGYYGTAVINYNRKNYKEAVINSRKAVELYKNGIFEKYSHLTPDEKEIGIANSERIIFYAYLKSKNYEQGFDEFFSTYPSLKKGYNNKEIFDIIKFVSLENEKIKNSHKSLYEKNIERFKKSGI
ncbi:MAG: hypothetical protein Q4D53_08090 [Leptotrichiaceae bacterium]|nr:hypothetical protein [Leptotrichiaceae bacterium]